MSLDIMILPLRSWAKAVPLARAFLLRSWAKTLPAALHAEHLDPPVLQPGEFYDRPYGESLPQL